MNPPQDNLKRRLMSRTKDYTWILFLLMIIIGTIGLIFLSLIGTHIEEKKCYDHYNNEIKGIICFENISNSRAGYLLEPLLYMCLIIGGFGFLIEFVTR